MAALRAWSARDCSLPRDEPGEKLAQPLGLPHAGEVLMDWVTKDDYVEFLIELP
jgi:hypothetical protein